MSDNSANSQGSSGTPSNAAGNPSAVRFDPNWLNRISQRESPAIRATGLQHFYGSGELRKQVLFDNNLEIYPGEIIIMTGPSGSGKTTLLTLIGTLRKVQDGELYVLDRPLHKSSSQDLLNLRREIGFVFQAHNLFDSLTATQNVRMALELAEPHGTKRAHTLRAKEMLTQVGLGERTGHKPKQLSGGQKQRVAIARGLVHQPKLILADEPTAALDEKSGRTVVDLLRKMAKEENVTIIIVTHDNRILDVADRIVNLVDGSIRSDVLVQEAAIVSQMLVKCEVFKHLTPRGLAEMADHLQSESFAAGVRVIREGDLGDRFYLIRKGAVAVRRGPNEAPVAKLKEGDFFGEMALLTGQPRNASVVTLEDTVLYSLRKEQFQVAIAQQASFETEIRTSLFDRH
ncbi:ATP-binding cassette domain-containing protein [Aureliella helgolandensis]|uniref:Macrolide export ATP-binding/permease protein MacB n=1 Tax=Aureliella helgolandensis TaxID=2527968 RepID=A0A518GGC8_9BACT|nr:ATP-binding cassette domain-containing protein [Aureliella helgolandensis]QDV27649.1 Macrolide export ATP-binding/permease protein MacB [Aureliella helgolandensis]